METRTLTNKAHVIIYSRPDCHLCEEAKQEIKAADCSDDYTLDEINIESDPDLLRRYRYDIPVITINGIEAFRHRLTSDQFRQRIEEAGASPLPNPETTEF